MSYKADLGRAQILYGARRYPEARAAFASLQGQVSGDDRELVDLRIAECDFFLKRYAGGARRAAPYLDNASRKAEARFFALSALRELDRTTSSSRRRARSWTSSRTARGPKKRSTISGRYYILTNEDELAAKAFRELYEKFPSGTRAERAAWKYGWYRVQDRRLSPRRSGCSRAPRRRSAARTTGRRSSTGRLVRTASSATARRQTSVSGWSQTDYGNSYYGRLASVQLTPRVEAPRRRRTREQAAGGNRRRRRLRFRPSG